MAINFPDSPSVNQTHTHSGREWTWDGTSWVLSTNASNYTLPIATAAALGGIKVGANLSIDASTGVLSGSAGGGSGIGSVIEDTSPELGGNLDVNGKTITEPLGTLKLDAYNIEFRDTFNGISTYKFAEFNYAGPTTCKLYGGTVVRLETNGQGIKIGGGILDKDDQIGTAGQILSSTGSELDWIDAPSGGGASVTVSDAAPSTPSNGDLWFKSDEAVLKVRYEDGSSNQWVDALPMGVVNQNNFTGLSDTPSSLTADKWLKVNAGGTALEWTDAPTGGASVTVSDSAPSGPSAGDLWWDSDNGRLKVYYTDATPDSQWVDASPLGDSVAQLSGTMTGHIIPDTNAAYDFGSAEYKIRHLFLSDNSLKFVDDNNVEHALSVSNNKLHYEGKEVLANCVFTGLDNNDTIKYNGTNWVNAAAEAPSAPAFQSNWRIPL